MTKHGNFHWNELASNNIQASLDFYSKSLGWTYDEMPGPGPSPYYIAMSDGTPVGGLFDAKDFIPYPVPEHWLSYIAVDDIEARIQLAKDNGANILRDPFEVPEVGIIAIVQDPGQAAIGWIQVAPEHYENI